jgi:hypothetical protein
VARQTNRDDARLVLKDALASLDVERIELVLKVKVDVLALFCFCEEHFVQVASVDGQDALAVTEPASEWRVKMPSLACRAPGPLCRMGWE